MSLVPKEAIKKKPTVTTQHMATGHEERSRCNDSAVAQQLTAAKVKKARMPKIFKNLLSFIIITIFPRFPSEELKRLIILNEQIKRSVGTACHLSHPLRPSHCPILLNRQR